MRALVLALLAATACQSPTQLVVLVDSNFAVPAELAAVQVMVSDSDGEPVGAEYFDLSSFGVPMSFGIEGGDLTGEEIRIVVQGLTATDQLLVERIAVLEFVEGEKRLLPMYLARSCTGVACSSGQTCTENGCASSFIDVDGLRELEPGDELLVPSFFDAGVRPDAAIDASEPGTDAEPRDAADAGDPGADAGGPDAIADAGSIDAGPCTSSAECPATSLCVSMLGEDCDGSTPCECRLACDPFLISSGCPAADACYYRALFGDGVCLDRDLSTASNQRAPCLMPTDCDSFENFVCRTDPTGSSGECTSLCSEPDTGFCDARVPGTICDTDPFSLISVCLEAGPPFADISSPCIGNADCQSNTCLPAFSICSADCSGLHACPDGSACAVSFMGTDAWCMRYCFSDQECSNNPLFVCRLDFGNPGLCFYRCDDPNPTAACQPGFTCDTASGQCF